MGSLTAVGRGIALPLSRHTDISLRNPWSAVKVGTVRKTVDLAGLIREETDHD
jgi:hypothetical protein